MQGFEPSIDLEFENVFFKNALNLKAFLGSFSALFEVVTGSCKNGGIRAGGHFGGHL